MMLLELVSKSKIWYSKLAIIVSNWAYKKNLLIDRYTINE